MLGKIYCKRCKIELVRYAYILNEDYLCSDCFRIITTTAPITSKIKIQKENKIKDKSKDKSKEKKNNKKK